jgi:hypothetical protein
MENNEVNNESIKPRGTTTCVFDGFKLLWNNLLSLIKFLWPTLIVLCVSAALISCILGPLMTMFETISPNIHPDVHLNLPVLISFIALIAIYFIGSLFFGGQVFTCMQKYTQLGYFPKMSFRGSWKEIRHNTWKYFLFMLVVSVICIVVTILLVIVSSRFISSSPSVFRAILFDLCVIFLIMLMLVPLLYSLVNYMLDTVRLQDMFFRGIAQGFKSYGFIFVILLISSIFVLIIQTVANLPNSILMFCKYQSVASVISGDAADLPGYFIVLQFVFSFIGQLVKEISVLGIWFALMFFNSTLILRRKEKLRFEQEKEALNNNTAS